MLQTQSDVLLLRTRWTKGLKGWTHPRTLQLWDLQQSSPPCVSWRHSMAWGGRKQCPFYLGALLCTESQPQLLGPYKLHRLHGWGVPCPGGCQKKLRGEHPTWVQDRPSGGPLQHPSPNSTIHHTPAVPAKPSGQVLWRQPVGCCQDNKPWTRCDWFLEVKLRRRNGFWLRQYLDRGYS